MSRDVVRARSVRRGRVAGWFGPPARTASTAAATASTVTTTKGPRARVDTLNDMVSPPDPGSGGEALEPAAPPLPEPPEAPARKARRPWRTVGIVATSVLVVLIVQVLVAAGFDTPWVALEPGAATSTDDLLAVDGAQTYDDPGEILYLTVRTNRLTVLEWITKARDPYIDILREQDYYQEREPEEVREENLAMMSTSKSHAVLVALDHLGYDVFDPAGAQVTGVEQGSAAEGSLAVNDIIVDIDATTVTTADELITVLRSRMPGDAVSLTVEDISGGNSRTVEVTLRERPDGTEGGFLGISVTTWAVESPDIPLDVEIDSGEVGGDSAGLAFTLSIIDALTPGSLMGDHTVAVTGTINLDGTVGHVGGVAQKAVAARRAGAQYMLVPRALEAQALKNAGDMQVIPVSTLEEALHALAGLGGNAEDLALPGEATTN
jgi:PDZ domain-containing protein